MDHEKILPFDGCEQRFAALRAAGTTIVHCHGTFDLLHPGHVKHLESAKRLGEQLVVSVTSAPFVNKGPGRPVFTDQERAYQLAHLQVVDHVVVVPAAGAVEVIDKVRPHIYCKGAEYATPGNLTDRRIDEDASAVKRWGGEVQFVGAPLHSSTRLAAGHLSAELRDFLESMPKAATLTSIDEIAKQIQGLRVLVLGELIVDRYTYCYVQGLTSKARVLSVRPIREENHLGGALAVARQVASYGCATRMLSVAGSEPWLDEALQDLADEALDLELIRDPQSETILKQRFVEQPGKRTDLMKYFATSRLKEPPPAAAERLRARTAELLEDVDVVILCDYGHGLVDPALQKLLQERAPFLALNVQTNSANFGFNLITRYDRCDLFSLDERELTLACGERGSGELAQLERIARKLNVRYAWLTLGSSGSLVWTEDQAQACPAMTQTTLDTVGAGDSFFATAALCGSVGADLHLSSLLANVAGALATRQPGNREVVHQTEILKNTRYLLKSAT